MKKKIIIAFATLLFLTSCAAKTPEKRVLKIAVSSLNHHFDPTYQEDGRELLRWGIGETLFRKGKEGKVEAWLATSLSSDNGLDWQLQVRDNVFFSNGKRLLANMVLRNLQRMAEYHPQAKYLAEARYELEGQRLHIHLKTPRYSLPEDFSEAYSVLLDLDATSDFVQYPIATGPYQIAEFHLQESLLLHANPYYWQKEVKEKEVLIQRVSQEEGLRLFQKGEVEAFLGAQKTIEETEKEEKKRNPRQYLLDYNEANLSLSEREFFHQLLQKQAPLGPNPEKKIRLRYEPSLRTEVESLGRLLTSYGIVFEKEETETPFLDGNYELALLSEKSPLSIYDFERFLTKGIWGETYLFDPVISRLGLTADQQERERLIQELIERNQQRHFYEILPEEKEDWIKHHFDGYDQGGFSFLTADIKNK